MFEYIKNLYVNKIIKPQLIKEFWHYFQENEKNIIINLDNIANVSINRVMINALSNKIKKINHHLRVQVNILDEKFKQFVITNNETDESYDDLKLLYKYKPNIDEWDITTFDQPLKSFDGREINCGTIHLKCNDVLFSLHEYEGSIHVLLFIPDYIHNNETFDMLKWYILDQCFGGEEALKKVKYCNAYSKLEYYNLFDTEKAANAALDNISMLKERFDEMYEQMNQHSS